MLTTHNPPTIAPPVGRYSHAVEVPAEARWLYVSGTPGVRPDGTVADGIAAQSEWAWKNVLAILACAGMGVNDLVKVTQTLTRPADIPAYIEVRTRVLGDARPASMLAVIPALVQPAFLVEVEAIAAKA